MLQVETVGRDAGMGTDAGMGRGHWLDWGRTWGLGTDAGMGRGHWLDWGRTWGLGPDVGTGDGRGDGGRTLAGLGPDVGTGGGRGDWGADIGWTGAGPLSEAPAQEPPAEQPAPPSVERLGPYELLGVLGEGGMATVYEALDTRNQRQVALKVIRPELQLDPEFVQRFEREIEISRLLQHPNLVEVFEDGSVDGRRFLAMEKVLGRSLHEVLQAGRLELNRFASYASQIAAGLHFAHSKQICHRDIKSSNIVVGADDKLKILDFGLAIEDGQNRFTSVGYAMGTPAYMAPEVLVQGTFDPRSDQYSFGILCYEMLVGQVPFQGDMMEVARAHVKQAVPSLSRQRTDLPEDWEQAVLQMVHKSPGQRFEDMQQAVSRFQRAEVLV